MPSTAEPAEGGAFSSLQRADSAESVLQLLAVVNPVRGRHFLKSTQYTKLWFSYMVESSTCKFSRIDQD